MQTSSEDIRIATEQRWVVLNEYSFHAIGVNRFEVREVANDLANGPFAWNWVFAPVFRNRLADCINEVLSALFVLLQQFIEGHSGPVWSAEGGILLGAQFRSRAAGDASERRMGRPTGVVTSFSLSIPSCWRMVAQISGTVTGSAGAGGSPEGIAAGVEPMTAPLRKLPPASTQENHAGQ